MLIQGISNRVLKLVRNDNGESESIIIFENHRWESPQGGWLNATSGGWMSVNGTNFVNINSDSGKSLIILKGFYFPTAVEGLKGNYSTLNDTDAELGDWLIVSTIP